MKSLISCYSSKTKKVSHFIVPKDVYTYICQLEAEIRHKKGAVQKMYPWRFWPKGLSEEMKERGYKMVWIDEFSDDTLLPTNHPKP
jgi:hypothetical protein